MLEPRLREISDLFFASAVDAALLVKALDALNDYIGCRASAIIPFQGRAPGIPVTAELEAATQSYFNDDWYKKDEREKAFGKMLRTGLASEKDFITPDLIERSEYYNEFLAKHDFKWFAGMRIDAGPNVWALALQRTDRQGIFSDDDLDRLKPFLKPLSDAATLSAQMGGVLQGQMVDLLESMGVPALLIGRSGSVLKLNGKAEALLARGLGLRNGLLVTNDVTSTQALQNACTAAAWSSTLNWQDGHDATVIVKRLLRRPLAIRIQSLPGIAASYFAPARAIATIADLDDDAPSEVSLMKAAFGLTNAEARLAQLIAAGADLPAAAAALEVGIETIRSQLKQLFRKTDTKRQAELAVVLKRLTGSRMR